MKVFVVTEGDYEDEQIRAVCSTLKKAQLAKRLYNSTNGIAEWELDNLPEHPKNTFPFMVKMDVNGNLADVISTDYSSLGTEWEPEYSNNPVNVIFRVWAKDEEDAVNVADKKRLELIKNNEWTTDYDKWLEKRIFEEENEKNNHK